MVYRFGGAPAAAPAVQAAGPVDTDGDGLTDEQEARLGTNPRDRDTDKDGLTDGEEVNTCKTDPLNPDTDFDMLKDGPEVKQYKTNPLVRDTDKGGVYDGHEVLEDKTDPLNGADDLMMFELLINFEYDQTIVKPEYIPELKVIAKVLQRNQEATAKIEGHTDRKTRSSEKYNQDLSEQRAKKVLELLVAQGIEQGRLTSTGFGFHRPKVQPDLVNGNPENRRVEVFLMNAGGRPAKEAMIKSMEQGK
jgi:outer membrane protein OmpA-like peptidoglycan-associated protein